VRVLAVAVEGQGLVDPAEPVFGAGDEALLRGAAAFETIRVDGGRPFRLDAHLERLDATAARLGLPGVRGAAELVRSAIEAAGADPLVLRVYRTSEQLVVTVGAPPEDLAELRARGQRLASVVVRLDPQLAGLKTTSYATNVAARVEAERRGADDALLVTGDGVVLESAMANVWWRRGDELFTPEPRLGILPGVTRDVLFGLAGRVTEGAFPLEQLLAADEAFTSSSVREVMPVVEVDGRPIGDGSPGRSARELQAALRRVAASEAAGPR
jgi:branched-subunit amino acid aminotransferase/4-amino-4-deoxychorismate lyase